MNINSDTAFMRGVRTAIQAAIGFIVGLVITVWAVPGVPAAVSAYVAGHWIQLALTMGLPSGAAAFIWNAMRKDVPTLKG